MIPFNKPSLVGKELEYIADSVASGRTSGDGKYTLLCQQFLEETFGFKKTLLTTSCTDALEIAARLLELKEGDEVIMPSFAFVSLATAFTAVGAKVVFADCEETTGNISVESVKRKITPRTKALIVIHYAGVACEMMELTSLCKEKGITLIEDVALAFDATFEGKPLGTFGAMATFSFHETKNISCGEGGALCINDEQFVSKAEIIRDKGTNRAQMRRGEVQKYEWIAQGSSHLASDISAAYLYAQLENYKAIQEKRVAIWFRYMGTFQSLNGNELTLPHVPLYASVNGSAFHFFCSTGKERDELIGHLEKNNIKAVFHYLPLHLSPYYLKRHAEEQLPHSEKVAATILRLPLFFGLEAKTQDAIIDSVLQFYRRR